MLSHLIRCIATKTKAGFTESLTCHYLSDIPEFGQEPPFKCIPNSGSRCALDDHFCNDGVTELLENACI